jgi:protoporphyrin/coproporphyrin ferrochelatase
MAEARASTPARAGILLVNLGTPEAPTACAVRRYLREFLSDPRVVKIPRLAWLPILYLVILPFRPIGAARKYRSIWREDGSPLRVYLARQVQMLRGYLGERTKKAVPVAGGMRYGTPTIAAALAELRERQCDRVVVLPLFPQYAESTTASTEDAVAKALRAWKPSPAVKVVRDFHAHPLYIDAIARNVNDYWMKHGRPDRLVMSFHGLPKAVVDAGDPYADQCRATAKLVATELGWNDARTLLTFQSRLGRAEWLTPYTAQTLARLGREGVARVDVICPGFAADCLETLEEIAQLGREQFLEAGGKEFHYIPTTNDTPSWMTALAAIAAENL